MNFLNIISDNVAQAIAWTIIHSLWQGLIIAIIYVIIKSFLKNVSANLKYILSVSSLVAFFIVSIVTFIVCYHPQPTLNPASEVNASEVYIVRMDAAEAEPYQKSLAKTAIDFTNNYSSLIFYLYLVGLLLFGIRLLGGLFYVSRIRKNYVQQATAHWYAVINDIAERLNISKRIILAESAHVNVPVIIGYFKPVILLPIGAFTNLSPAQVEAILIHELAHIRRNDYLINIFQSIIEVIFFYHPAIWWLSSEIRSERENCCDDIVVDYTEDSITYARALSSLKSYNSTGIPLALAVTGNKKRLLHRINRILSKPKNGTSMKEKIITIAGLMVFVFFIAISANANLSNTSGNTIAKDNNARFSYVFNIEDLVWKKLRELDLIGTFQQKELSITEENTSVADTPGGGGGKTIKVEEKIDGKKHKVKIKLDEDGEIEQLKVNGKKIPEEKYNDYRAVIKDALGVSGIQGYSYSIPRGNTYIYPPAPPVPPLPGRSFAPPAPPAPPKNFKDDRARENYERQMKQYEKQIKKFENSIKGFEYNIKGFGENMEGWSKDFNNSFKIYADTLIWKDGIDKSFKIYADSISNGFRYFFNDSIIIIDSLIKGQAYFLNKNAEEIRKEVLKEIDVEKIRTEAEKGRLLAEKERNAINTIEEELLKDNFISDKENYSIELNGNVLKINGKVQPDHIHSKYKKMYEKATGRNLDEKGNMNIIKRK